MSWIKRVLTLALALGLLSVLGVQAAIAAPQKLSVPVDGLIAPNACADPVDLVVLSGNLDVTVNVKFDQGGKIASGKVSYNAGGIKGTGANGKYTGNGTGNANFKVGEPLPAQATVPGHFFLLQPGSNNDLKVSFLLKFLVHWDGSVSDPKVEIRQAECGEFKI